MSIGDVHSNERGSGARFNTGKVALELVPLLALEDCARVFDYGRKKYAEWNWAKGMAWSVPLACLLRHLSAFQRGEDTDPESGLPHLGHAMCNLVMLSTFAQTYTDGDDRPKQWLTVPAAEALAMVEMSPPDALSALVAESQRLGLYNVPELAPEVEARVYADVDDAAPVPMEHAEAVSR